MLIKKYLEICVFETLEATYADEDADDDYVGEESMEDRRREPVALFRRRSARNRELPMNSRQQYVLDWVSAHSAVVSGSLNMDKLQYSTYAEAYKKYKEQSLKDEVEPYSFASFHGLLFRWAISPQHYDKYSCPTCYLLFHSGKAVLDIERDEHQQRKGAISGAYADEVEQINKGVARFFMVVMDYSRIHELRYTGPNETSQSKLSVLNFTVVFNGGSQRQFDYFSTSKQGVQFMSRAMRAFGDELKSLFDRADYEEIHFWSDGGLKTYGTVDNMLHLSKALGTTIIHTYFAPYHGHSRCDAHFGRGKQLLRKYYPQGGLHHIAQVLSAFRQIPETLTELLPAVVEPEGKWSSWHGVSGIRSMDQIMYKNGVIHIARFIAGRHVGWTQV